MSKNVIRLLAVVLLCIYLNVDSENEDENRNEKWRERS